MKRLTTQQFIDKAKKIHGDKYEYSKVIYKRHCDKVCIICPIHGEFWQRANDHLNGKGCFYCFGKRKSSAKEFIEKARKIHGDFEQEPIAHLKGQGCPYCYAEHKNLTETRIKQFLSNKNINFIYQKHFKWLGRQSLDFYFPEYNSAIEYQGRQHFSTESYFYEFKRDEILNLDLRKLKLCNEHGVKLYHLTNEVKYIPEDWEHYKLYTSLDDILQEMRNV